MIISPHAVQRAIAVAVNQATRIGFVGWILFDDFTRPNADKRLSNRDAVSDGLLVSVVGNSDVTLPDGFGNLFKIDQTKLL